MPQGSDYEQRIMLKRQRDIYDCERLSNEIADLRGRIWELEGLVQRLLKKLDVLEGPQGQTGLEGAVN
ncbi:MAG: hypothetical protein PHV85_11290 [Desulfovibrionaceae bacterium]|nr:hypothetical protein [Desulfovibrionaceae bacterium]MDD4953124.1 hypothetical protein [Desulfovibrionaceae bacterium]